MSQTFKARSKLNDYDFVISNLDARLLAVVHDRVLPKNGSLLQKLVWWAPQDRPRSVNRESLLEEVRLVLQEIECDLELLYCVYTHKCHVIDANGIRWEESGTGMTAGIRLEGDQDHFYAIKCGVGVCELQQWGVDADGLGVRLKTTDCRRMKTIETLNNGTVILKKRKVKSNLLESLVAFKAFLEVQTEDQIEIMEIASRSKR